MHKVTFGKSDNLWGNRTVPILIDGAHASDMHKAEDGTEWYTYGETPQGDPCSLLCEADLGSTRKEAEKTVRWLVRNGGDFGNA